MKEAKRGYTGPGRAPSPRGRLRFVPGRPGSQRTLTRSRAVPASRAPRGPGPQGSSAAPQPPPPPARLRPPQQHQRWGHGPFKSPPSRGPASPAAAAACAAPAAPPPPFPRRRRQSASLSARHCRRRHLGRGRGGIRTGHRIPAMVTPIPTIEICLSFIRGSVSRKIEISSPNLDSP
ncbi:formin-like protein 20 [Chelonia mydas]|uniref:formin-like protein 20 n=1 Tax=Chelonia mydas TaxID=8469 RepID=UPI001CA8B41D|nr:formin-like protein 20 [Chelonia mydas]